MSLDGDSSHSDTESAIEREKREIHQELEDIILEAGPLVVRTKHITSAPMTVEQALEAMELVGHDFYVFHNAETGHCNVLYRRRGYDFGLMELQHAS